MGNDTASWVVHLWQYAGQNDLPNWFGVAFTAILWPIALFAWSRRRTNSIDGLEVRFAPGSISIDSHPHDAVDIRFINHTGSVVYVTGARIRHSTSAFRVPLDASRDIAKNSHHLSFNNGSNRFELREQTIQTNTEAQTCIAAPGSMPDEFYRYTAPWYRRVIRSPKYFVLEYTAMVGTTRRAVATLY
jgi:hypothetical protein